MKGAKQTNISICDLTSKIRLIDLLYSIIYSSEKMHLTIKAKGMSCKNLKKFPLEIKDNGHFLKDVKISFKSNIPDKNTDVLVVFFMPTSILP